MSLSNDELKRLQQRSGLARARSPEWSPVRDRRQRASLRVEHRANRVTRWSLLVLAAVLGFTLVTMFAAMHESVHRTAFKSRWLNDGVGGSPGLLSFYNSTFYRYYHGWHHRFTQIAGRDPELEDAKPTSVASYLLELSGVPGGSESSGPICRSRSVGWGRTAS